MTDSPKKSQPEFLRSSVTTYDSSLADLEDTDLCIDQYLLAKTSFLLGLLADFTQNTRIFFNLDQNQRRTLLKAMDVKEYEKDDFIFKIGETANNFYIVRSGKFKACEPYNDNIREYYKGDMICELAVIFPFRHEFHIKALTFGSVWFINRQTFRRIKLTLLTRKRKICETYLATIPLFKKLHSSDFINLADCLQKRSVKKGDFVYKQQSLSDGLYIVENGIINICVLDDVGKQVILYKIKKGEYFGERSMITCCPRNSSAIAEVDTVVAFLRVSAFERLKGFCKDIAVEDDISDIFGSKNNIFNMREF